MRNEPQGSTSRAHDDSSTEQLARDLYERVRQLNHATNGPPGLTQPGTVYTVLGNLGAAAYGLDQTIEQLNDFLLHEEEQGRLGHDRDEATAPVLQECGRALSAARKHSGGLHAALSEAQSAINAIHGGPVSPHNSRTRSPVELAAEDFPVSVQQASSLLRGSDRQPPQGASTIRPVRKDG
ncbi:hypothetical protein [Actinomadura rudentiformis]|uniref:Uncharacterized protein n=1 Tax=Actinomadura rudentiformis TaxID=359158 RepID=A0A6H9YVG9_9ACTN|nr:hypothetical protein [Actinomadura rudentiformis]KAB2351069.1 hypothetical protein F8566_09060 [Actinomadura rudentiformis]